jgi:hypothetical protein
MLAASEDDQMMSPGDLQGVEILLNAGGPKYHRLVGKGRADVRCTEYV